MFVFGVLLGPLLHNVGHRNDHVHGHYGILPLYGGHEHSPVHPHSHPHPHPHGAHHADTEPDDGDSGHPDPDHGKRAPEHFAAAVLVPAIFVLPPLGRTLEILPLPIRASVHLGRKENGSQQPRAPPAESISIFI